MNTETDVEKTTESFADKVNEFLTSEEEKVLTGDSWEQINTFFNVLGEKEAVLLPNSTEDDLKTYIHSPKYGNFYYTYKKDPQSGTVKFSLIKSLEKNDN
jgi:hypothetical protein